MERITVFLALLFVGLAGAFGHSWSYNNVKATGVLKEGIVNPGICDTVNQSAGYYEIDAATHKNYFYWAFDSRGNPDTDPTVLWMTGGPGCSSLTALFFENGPCTLAADGVTTIPNTYSWNKNANLIFIDQPANTGFSYSDSAGEDTNEKEVAEDMYHFLQDIFQAHPQWQTNDFFITGESYGGHFVPATAHRVWAGNKAKEGLHIPLKGLGIGNGLTDPEIQYQYYSQMAYNYSISKIGHAVISQSSANAMVAAWPRCKSLITACQTVSASCSIAQSYCNQAMLGPYEQTGLNPYDIRIKCAKPPLCYDFGRIDTYLNSAKVQKALGVSRKWTSCNFEVNGKFSNDWMKNFQQDIPDLLADGIRVLVYAGDVDFICNWLGNQAWTLALPWPGQSAFNAAPVKPWLVSGKAAGEVRSAKSFTFLRVYDAGHMVPMDQPEAALALLTTLLTGQPF